MASGLISGTGILHAGAIMQTLRYNQAMSAVVGEDPTSEAVEAYICRTVEKGHVVPGYGHALLRGADPRLEPITRFINTRSLPPSASSEKRKMLKLIGRTSTIVPDILRRHVPRMKSTAPNVDSLSGCLMYIHGLDIDFILLVMGCSRGMGFMAQYVWDRGLYDSHDYIHSSADRTFQHSDSLLSDHSVLLWIRLWPDCRKTTGLLITSATYRHEPGEPYLIVFTI